MLVIATCQTNREEIDDSMHHRLHLSTWLKLAMVAVLGCRVRGCIAVH